jgi:hypothetical protein
MSFSMLFSFSDVISRFYERENEQTRELALFSFFFLKDIF